MKNQLKRWAIAIVAILLVQTGNVRAENNPIAVKDFVQILYTFQAATGISRTSRAVKEYYLGAKSRLPKTGAVTEINSSAVLAYLGLANVFCKSMIARESQNKPENRQFLKEIEFQQYTPNINPRLLQSAISEFATIFWQRDIEADELAKILEFTQDFQSDDSSKFKLVSNLLELTCTMVASSVDAYTY